MCADICTKGCSACLKWRSACDLINIVDPARLNKLVKPEVQRAIIPFSLAGGAVSVDHVDDSCASNRLETVATEMACASNRVFVGGLSI